MKFWKKRTQEEIKSIVFEALEKNLNYSDQNTLGVPASQLDDKVFNQDNSFLSEAPFLSALVRNPNHIGCHTTGSSESFFKGTQAIEKELIRICAQDILKGAGDEFDGYLASGGTEANIQAIWIYRNYFLKEYGANHEDICILCSEDSHYSLDKAANLLALDILKTGVDENSRELSEESLTESIRSARNRGKKYFIVVCNMMTTMFGSVDDIYKYVRALEANDVAFKIHVDGAYGGFYYPFSQENSPLTFQNEYITSFTLDAHKMAQAPYGTGIFLIRKNYIRFVNTKQATYVEGEDLTLIGSRSGANAIAAWMILLKNGPYGWREKVFILQKRTEWMCQQLGELNMDFYRHESSNIIAIKARDIKKEVATAFGLVPDAHHNPQWYKIVIMEHVTIEKLMALVEQIAKSAYRVN